MHSLKSVYIMALIVVCVLLPSMLFCNESASSTTALSCAEHISGLKNLGIALFKDTRSVLIENTAEGTTYFYDVGDDINGLRIAKIEKDHFILSHDGSLWKFTLANELTLLEAPSPPTPQVVLPDLPHNDQPESEPLKNLIISPIKFLRPMIGKLRSSFGNRKHPMGGSTKFHTGVDIAAPHGTPVCASADGKVIFADRNGGYGNYIIIKHSSGYSTRYGHLSKIKARRGKSVKQGDIIGYEGNTGKSTGPHLHFEIRKNNKPQAPSLYIDFTE